MRTKTILLAAVLGLASAATSMAQVYSANVVGYVNQTFTSSGNGFQIVANPLNNTSGGNAVSNLFPSPPLFSTIYKFVPGTGPGSGYQPNTFGFGGWGDPNMTFAPGEGAFFQATANFTNTYVGDALIGARTNSLPVGFALRSSILPQAGLITTTLLLPAQLFDTLYQFTPGAGYTPFTFGFGGWAPEPNIGVAEGFFYLNSQGTTTLWPRTFNP